MILSLVLGFVYLLAWLLKHSSPKVDEIMMRIKAFLAWNLTITVAASASLRSCFFIFLDFAYTTLSNAFSIISFVSAVIAAILWIVVIIALMTYGNRKRMKRAAKGKTSKAWTERGRFDVVYEEFKENQYLHKYYFSAFLFRNLTMGAALAWLQAFPLVQITAIWMIQGGFTLSIVIVRPWKHFYKLIMHLLFDIPLLVALGFALAISVANDETGFTVEYKAALASGFITIYIILFALNLALGLTLIGLSIFRLLSRPAKPVQKSPQVVHIRRKEEVTPANDNIPEADSRAGDFTSVSIVDRKIDQTFQDEFPGLDSATTRPLHDDSSPPRRLDRLSTIPYARFLRS